MNLWAFPALSKLKPMTRIYPGLYMGSEEAMITKKKFDVVVCAAQQLSEPTQMAGNFEYVKVPLQDVEWDFADDMQQLLDLIELTSQLANVVKRGGKVLIYCQMGLNRSGLLTGLTLLHLGYIPKDVIKMIKRRSKITLSNKSFVKIINYSYQYLI
jgi:protein-tyrosine phosphatase